VPGFCTEAVWTAQAALHAAELLKRDVMMGLYALLVFLCSCVRVAWLLSPRGRLGELFPPDRYLIFRHFSSVTTWIRG
jgi:hypothetical protein